LLIATFVTKLQVPMYAIRARPHSAGVEDGGKSPEAVELAPRHNQDPHLAGSQS
jgi:hypothetical protein